MLARMFAQVVRGFIMGSADVVPGVSGGTMAFVLGIYPHLIETIADGARMLASLVRLDLRSTLRLARGIDWLFLVPLLGGIALAILTLAGVIGHLLEAEPVKLAGAFFGLVVGSIFVVWRRYARFDRFRLFLLLVAATTTFFGLGFRGEAITSPHIGLVFLGGAVAICAMILPGISGAFILLMIGIYGAMIAAVNERDLLVAAVFILGAAIGLGLFSNLLKWMLSNHESTVIAVLIGVMAGSLRVLWPWPQGTAGTTLGAPSGDVVVPLLLAMAGAAAAILLALVADRQEAP